MKETDKEILEKELRETKKDLLDLEAYIEEFSKFLPLPVCTINPAKRIIDINKKFESITSYDSMEIVGEPIKKLFLEKEEVDVALEKAKLEEKIIEKEAILVSKKEKEIPVMLSISMRRDNSDNFIGYFISISDITEIKQFREQLEEKVKQRTVEIKRRMNELERFRKLVVGRELKMVNLKKENEALKKELEEQKSVQG